MAVKNQVMSVFLNEDKQKKYLQSILGERTSQFITSLCTLVGSNSNLQDCDRVSLMSCALKATSMNLPFDQNLGFAYAIPYKRKIKKPSGEWEEITEAQFQMGVKGYIQLAQRTSQIEKLNAIEVVEGEFKGRDIFGEPVIQFLQDEDERNKLIHEGKIIGYLAAMKLINGFIKIIYWSKNQLLDHADRYSQSYKWAEHGDKSKGGGKKDSVWHTNFEAMAKKTVLKNLISQYAPLTTEMREAIKYDQSVITIGQNGEEKIDYVDSMESMENINLEAQAEIESNNCQGEVIDIDVTPVKDKTKKNKERL